MLHHWIYRSPLFREDFYKVALVKPAWPLEYPLHFTIQAAVEKKAWNKIKSFNLYAKDRILQFLN